MTHEEVYDDRIVIFLLSLLVIAIIFEGTLLAIGFIYADKVECNLIWCTFVYKDNIDFGVIEMNSSSNSYITSYTNITSKCYLNGKEVNCSDI